MPQLSHRIGSGCTANAFWMDSENKALRKRSFDVDTAVTVPYLHWSWKKKLLFILSTTLSLCVCVYLFNNECALHPEDDDVVSRGAELQLRANLQRLAGVDGVPSITAAQRGSKGASNEFKPAASPSSSASKPAAGKHAPHAAAALRCDAKGTAPHPAVVTAGSNSGQANDAHARDVQYQLLTAWGLRPLDHSPLSHPEAPHSNTSQPWRGGAVRVRPAGTEAPGQDVTTAAGTPGILRSRPLRSVDDTLSRRSFHHSCLGLQGPRGTATTTVSGGKLGEDDGMQMPPEMMLNDRAKLLTHGLELHAIIQTWLTSVAGLAGVELGRDKARDRDRDEPAGPAGISHERDGFIGSGDILPPANAPFYEGPWIEDYWLATFNTPVLTTLKRGLYDKLKTGPAAAHVQLQEQGQDNDEDGGHSASSPGTADTVPVRLPYDPELFHPWVPLFLPWMNVMSLLEGLDAAQLEDQIYRARDAGQEDLSGLEYNAADRPKSIETVCVLAQTLSAMMRQDVAYVTVVQRAAGPWLLQYQEGKYGSMCARQLINALRSVLVISAGGIGHVPIPLLGKERPLLQCAADSMYGSDPHDGGQEKPAGRVSGHASPALRGPARAFTDGVHAVSFLGSARQGARQHVLSAMAEPSLPSLVVAQEPAMGVHNAQAAGSLTTDALLAMWGVDLHASGPASQQTAGRQGSSYDSTLSPRVKVEHLWLSGMASSLLQLAPRGTGPTSFRLYEALQMGLVPVYVHDGAPWLPYLKRGQSPTWMAGKPWEEQSLWARIALIKHVDSVRAWAHAPVPKGLASRAGAEPHDDDVLQALDQALATVGTTAGEEVLQRMRLDAAAVRDRYFTHDGVVRRIAEFLDDPFTAELDCQAPSFI